MNDYNNVILPNEPHFLFFIDLSDLKIQVLSLNIPNVLEPYRYVKTLKGNKVTF